MPAESRLSYSPFSPIISCHTTTSKSKITSNIPPQSIFNYLVDTYTIYAASVLAANSVLRSLFGFAFPLFATYMYENLGIHWASSIPAFLALACVPAPFLFYKYGPRIRRGQKYSREAEEMMIKVLRVEHEDGGSDENGKEEKREEESSGDEIANSAKAEGNGEGEEKRGRGRSATKPEADGGQGQRRRDDGREGIAPTTSEAQKKAVKPRASLIGADEDVDLEKGLVE